MYHHTSLSGTFEISAVGYWQMLKAYRVLQVLGFLGNFLLAL